MRRAAARDGPGGVVLGPRADELKDRLRACEVGDGHAQCELRLVDDELCPCAAQVHLEGHLFFFVVDVEATLFVP